MVQSTGANDLQRGAAQHDTEQTTAIMGLSFNRYCNVSAATMLQFSLARTFGRPAKPTPAASSVLLLDTFAILSDACRRFGILQPGSRGVGVGEIALGQNLRFLLASAFHAALGAVFSSGPKSWLRRSANFAVAVAKVCQRPFVLSDIHCVCRAGRAVVLAGRHVAMTRVSLVFFLLLLILVVLLLLLILAVAVARHQ